MEAHSRMHNIHGEFARFLIVGVANTLSSYLLYLLLLTFFPYLIAYSLAYCVGIVLSYFMNTHFVFKRRVSLATFLAFPLVYLIQYGLGALILWLLVDQADVTPSLAMAGVIAATIPITFLTSRFVLRKG
jgi:putative flippase GtrA